MKWNLKAVIIINVRICVDVWMHLLKFVFKGVCYSYAYAFHNFLFYKPLTFMALYDLNSLWYVLPVEIKSAVVTGF